MGWIVSSKNSCIGALIWPPPTPTPWQYFRMWLCLEGAFKEVIKSKWSHYVKPSFKLISILRRREDWDMTLHRGKVMWRHWKKMAISKWRREASERNQSCWHLPPTFLGSRMLGRYISVVWMPHSVVFVMAVWVENTLLPCVFCPFTALPPLQHFWHQVCHFFFFLPTQAICCDTSWVSHNSVQFWHRLS